MFWFRCPKHLASFGTGVVRTEPEVAGLYGRGFLGCHVRFPFLLLSLVVVGIFAW